ncbi:MAG: pyruvate kinase, partial [Steroidobacteraceae bacterium]|nr:pyruvate kinase [Steroidobacteraceae bacterium]
MRRTKIVATLGPATDDPAVLEDMLHEGLDVVRINASHGTRDDQRRRLNLLREVSAKLDMTVGVLLDLRGPKIRIEGFQEGKVYLQEGKTFVLDTMLDPKAGTAEVVGVAYKNLPRDVSPGDTLLLNDGQIVLGVESVSATRVTTRVKVGGELSDRKGLNRQGGGISAPALSDKDRDDIRFAAEEGIDYIAVGWGGGGAGGETAPPPPRS